MSSVSNSSSSSTRKKSSQSSTVKLPEEVVEHTWTIPDFLTVISATRPYLDTSLSSVGRFPFLIGSGTNPPDPTDHWPIKAEASLFYNSKSRSKSVCINLGLLKRPFHPLCSVHVSAQFIDIISDNQANQDTAILLEVETHKDNFKWSVSDYKFELFNQNETERFVDKHKALHIHFQLKVNITRPRDAQLASVEDCYDFQFCGSQLLGDFEAMLNDTATADFRVNVTGKENKTFHCHKTILAARSPMFRAMFDSPMKESQENVVEVNDISSKAMGHFLCFVYSGRFKHSSWIKSLPQLIYAADKYDVQSLKDLCDVHLIKVVTCKNAVALAKLAERLRLTKALSDVRKFIAVNVQKVTFDSSNESEDEKD